MTKTTPVPTRERLVLAAMELFHLRGYQATGLKDVLKKAEANSGSLYYFFKTKETLLIAVLDKYCELLHPQVIEPAFAVSDDPIERIFAVLQGYRRMLLSAEFKLGCPIGNLALEIGDACTEVREKIALNFANWCEAIRTCLEAAAERFPPELDHAALSRFVLAVMEGGIMQARAHKNIEPFDITVLQLRDYFDRLLAEGQKHV